MGVSDYQLSQAIPEELKSTLPTVEEVEQELTNLLERNNSANENNRQETKRFYRNRC
jgi:hypothetical protein